MNGEPENPGHATPPPLTHPKEDRLWAMAAHFSGPAGMLLSAGILLFLGPLVVYLAKRDESTFVADQALESLNFHLTMFLALVAGVIASVLTCGLGFLVFWIYAGAIWLVTLVLGIVGGLQAYEGVAYRYPLTLRLVR